MGFFDNVKRFLGKVGSGLSWATKLYDKGKDMYKRFKSTVSNLPVVGAAAESLIGKAETALQDKMKQKVGFNMSDVDKAVGVGKTVASVLPKG